MLRLDAAVHAKVLWPHCATWNISLSGEVLHSCNFSLDQSAAGDMSMGSFMQDEEYRLRRSPSREASMNDPCGHIERRMLESGKKDHRKTTETARRALQVAEQTADIASATLVEMQRQGTTLLKTDAGLTYLEKDVSEAGRVLRFMRRCCCFQILCCCDCFDPDVKNDRTRQRRLKERRLEEAIIQDAITTQNISQQAAVQRIGVKGDPAFNGNEDAARSELFASNVKRKSSSIPELGMGYGLEEDDRIELQAETQEQDEILDRIGTTVESLRIMSLEFQNELEAQAPQIDALQDRTHATHDNLASLARAARKV